MMCESVAPGFHWAILSSAADLDKAEANYERAKNELDVTLEELKDM